LGRPTKFNRDDAIEIAMNTFWSKGYAPTSVSDLATAMSITRSSFYNSFETCESVFAEALVRYKNDDIDIHLETRFPGVSAGDSLHFFFNQVSEKLALDPLARGCLIINCFVQASEENPAPPGVYDFIDTKFQQFANRVGEAKAEGELDPTADTDTVATSLLTFLIGLNVIGKTIREKHKLKAMAKQFLENAGFKSPKTD